MCLTYTLTTIWYVSNVRLLLVFLVAYTVDTFEKPIGINVHKVNPEQLKDFLTNYTDITRIVNGNIQYIMVS